MERKIVSILIVIGMAFLQGLPAGYCEDVPPPADQAVGPVPEVAIGEVPPAEPPSTSGADTSLIFLSGDNPLSQGAEGVTSRKRVRPVYPIPPAVGIPVVPPVIFDPAEEPGTVGTSGSSEQSPAVEPPPVEPPIMQPPVIEPPLVEPPVEPPVVELPPLEPPVVQPPVIEPPLVEPPIVELPPAKPPIQMPVKSRSRFTRQD